MQKIRVNSIYLKRVLKKNWPYFSAYSKEGCLALYSMANLRPSNTASLALGTLTSRIPFLKEAFACESSILLGKGRILLKLPYVNSE